MQTSGPSVKLLESASTVGKRVVFASLRIAESNLHRMSELPAEEEIRGMPPEVVGICNNGLPSLDLICASLGAAPMGTVQKSVPRISTGHWQGAIVPRRGGEWGHHK